MSRASALGRFILLATSILVAGACSSAPSPAAPARPPASGGTAASPAGAAAAAPAPPLSRLRASYGSTVAVHAPILLASQLGEFAREGLDVELQRIATNTSITALIAGELDLVQVSAPALVSANLQGGADLVFIAGALDRMIISLYAMPGIRSAADLRGRVLGSDRAGTPVAFAAALSLGRLGLTTDDVQVLPIGSDGMVPGMQAGQVHAGPVTLPHSTQIVRLGGHLLVDLHDVPYQNVGLIARRSEIERLAPALPPLLKVYRRGLQRFFDDAAWGKEGLGRLMETTDDSLMQEAYDFHTRQVPFTPSLRVSREGLQGVLDSLKEAVPAAATADLDQFYDHRFVDAIDRPA